MKRNSKLKLNMFPGWLAEDKTLKFPEIFDATSQGECKITGNNCFKGAQVLSYRDYHD